MGSGAISCAAARRGPPTTSQTWNARPPASPVSTRRSGPPTRHQSDNATRSYRRTTGTGFDRCRPPLAPYLIQVAPQVLSAGSETPSESTRCRSWRTSRVSQRGRLPSRRSRLPAAAAGVRENDGLAYSEIQCLGAGHLITPRSAQPSGHRDSADLCQSHRPLCFGNPTLPCVTLRKYHDVQWRIRTRPTTRPQKPTSRT